MIQLIDRFHVDCRRLFGYCYWSCDQIDNGRLFGPYNSHVEAVRGASVKIGFMLYQSDNPKAWFNRPQNQDCEVRLFQQCGVTNS